MSSQGKISFRFFYCYGSTEQPARGWGELFFSRPDWDQAKQWAFTWLIREIGEENLETDLLIAGSLSSREDGQTILSAEMENQDNPGAIRIADLLAVDPITAVGSKWFRKEIPPEKRKDEIIHRVRSLINSHDHQV